MVRMEIWCVGALNNIVSCTMRGQTEVDGQKKSNFMTAKDIEEPEQ